MLREKQEMRFEIQFDQYRSLNLISDEARIPPEFKHINKGRKRN